MQPNSDPVQLFNTRNAEMIQRLAADKDVAQHGQAFFESANRHEYSYHFSWLGRPIIQYPQDIVAIQEILWQIQPAWVVETGVAHGGSLILSASILELTHASGGVVGIDIDIRKHNADAIAAHPLSHRIHTIEGDSTSSRVIDAVRDLVGDAQPVVVILDSNHTHEHVLRELELYSPFVKAGSYLIVMDTVISKLPPGSFPDRPWDVDDSPATAVTEFLASNSRFAVDGVIDAKLQISASPGGYLRCVSNE